MDPKHGAKQRPTATEQQIKDTINNFAENFQNEGFIAFTKNPSINFIGRILVNYKGLGVIKFRKSQLQAGQFNQNQFKKICQERMNHKEQLFQDLQQKYPTSSVCIIQGGIFKSTGQLASFVKGESAAFIY